MVVPIKTHCVHILSGKVRWIGIKEGIGAVIMFNERLEVLILYNDIRHAVLQFMDQSEEFSDIKRLRGIGFSAA